MSRLVLFLFLALGTLAAGVIYLRATAGTLPPRLRELYNSERLDPDNNPCLKGRIPDTDEGHSERKACMLRECLRITPPNTSSQVPDAELAADLRVRACEGQADAEESSASMVELDYWLASHPR
jgi:hypothetical protein